MRYIRVELVHMHSLPCSWQCYGVSMSSKLLQNTTWEFCWFAVKGRPFLLAIEDPQAPENDIGKNSFGYFQVKSAFSMAFSTLTNAKTILSLGPGRSILGTIIRPDAVLLERKGGSNGEMTFNNLLPGAGEPLQANLDSQQEIYCNWKLDDEEEQLPRGKLNFDDGNTPSSGKKRKKASKLEKRAKKAKENGEESGSRKGKGKKKRRWREHGDGGQNNNGFSRYGGSRTSEVFISFSYLCYENLPQ